MYNEEEHKQLFKRFFGETTSLSGLFGYENKSLYMHNSAHYYCWANTAEWIHISYSQSPYTKIMNLLFGKDIEVFPEYDALRKVKYHVPSSFEEMTIICDLKGK